MSNSILAAPGTFALIRPEADGSYTSHPVVAWATDLGKLVFPKLVVNAQECAILFPDGTVSDRELQETYATLQDWEDAWAGKHQMGTVGDTARASEVDSEPTEEEEIEEGTPSDETTAISDVIELSSFCRNALIRNDINTVYDLSLFQKEEVAAHRGVSKESIRQLTKLLAAEGRTWGMVYEAEEADEIEAVEEDDEDYI